MSRLVGVGMFFMKKLWKARLRIVKRLFCHFVLPNFIFSNFSSTFSTLSTLILSKTRYIVLPNQLFLTFSSTNSAKKYDFGLFLDNLFEIYATKSYYILDLVAHFPHFSLFPHFSHFPHFSLFLHFSHFSHFRISALPLQVKSYARIKP